MTRLPLSFARTALIASVLVPAVLAGAAARAETPPSSSELRLEQRVDELAEQLQAVKAELARMKAERAAAATSAPGAVATAPPVAAANIAAPAVSPSPFANLNLWGYGEVYYTHPTHVPSDTQVDLARAVFGIGYQFDERTNFNSEYEVEHAVSSASDVGEFEVEQFFVDHQLTPSTTLRGGLFLMPFGLLNEHHEPTNFYGVQRNFVETLIIPSTWREGGIELNAHGQSGYALSAGLTTGFDLSKWNYAPEFPLYRSALELEDHDVAPLQATHQELALANGAHPSGHVALNYTGLPGLRLGAAIFVGEAVKVPAPPNAPILGEQRVTLWEGHARWQPAGFDLSNGPCTRTARSAIRRRRTPRTSAPRTRSRQRSTATSCRRPTPTAGCCTSTACRRSSATSTTTSARPMTAPAPCCRPAPCRCRPIPATTARGRAATTASGPLARTSS